MHERLVQAISIIIGGSALINHAVAEDLAPVAQDYRKCITVVSKTTPALRLADKYPVILKEIGEVQLLNSQKPTIDESGLLASLSESATACRMRLLNSMGPRFRSHRPILLNAFREMDKVNTALQSRQLTWGQANALRMNIQKRADALISRADKELYDQDERAQRQQEDPPKFHCYHSYTIGGTYCY